jgi:outer membrane protein assembly factor BamB
MADVFLSYSRDDTERVAPLADALREAGRRAGFAVWWDPMMLPGTTDFDQYLQERLDAAKCVVVVWSSTSVQSHYVKAEAEEGRARGILTPVLIDRVKLPLSFRFVQTADLSEWRPGRPSAEFDRLVVAITERVLGRPREAVAPGPDRLTEGAPQGASLDVIGAERWSARVTGAIRSAPAPGPHGDVYVVTEAGALHALGPDGRMRWSAVVGGAGHFSAPSVTVIPGGRVHVVFDRYLYAFDAGGSLSWKWTAPGGVTATPAFDDSGRVFVMTNNSELWAVSEQASELWRRTLCGVTGGGTWPGPACNGRGLVYAVCKGSEIHGVDAASGEVAWSVPANDRMESTPVVGADGAGYFASTGGWVFAINPDGSQRWLASVAPPPGKIAMVDAPLAIADDGSVIVAPRHGSLYALSADGEVKWDVPIGGQGTGGRPVAVSPNGTVYATTTNGELVAVGPDGTARARVRPGEAPSAPAVGGDGVLYVGVGPTLHAVEPSD